MKQKIVTWLIFSLISQYKECIHVTHSKEILSLKNKAEQWIQNKNWMAWMKLKQNFLNLAEQVVTFLQETIFLEKEISKYLELKSN